MPQLQQTVYQLPGAGVPGEAYDDSPMRSQPFVLDSEDATDNIFGSAFTIVSQGVAQAGGTGVFAGIMVNPKGTILPTPQLTPTLTVPNAYAVEMATMGSFWIVVPGACNIGDNIIFNQTNGVLSTVAPGADLPSGYTATNGFIDRFTPTGAGLAVGTFSSLPAVPVEASPLSEAKAQQNKTALKSKAASDALDGAQGDK